MRVTEIITLIGRHLPSDLAMPDDPVGLQVMSADREVSCVAVAYELNRDIAQRAADLGAELIVAFHPLIHAPLRSVRCDAGRVGEVVIELLRGQIALHIVHTAFDAHPRGTSALLAEALGLKNIRPLVRHAVRQDAGMGALGEFPESVTLSELAALVRSACRSELVRVSSPAPEAVLKTGIRRVAIVGGSGMSFYGDALSAGAEALVTADVRYHGFHRANDAIPVLDPGHAESERFVVAGLTELLGLALADALPKVRTVAIDEPTNPVRYIF